MFEQHRLEDHKAFLALDIGSRFIRASVCMFKKGKLNVLSEEQVLQNRLDFQGGYVKNIVGISETIAILLERIYESIGEVPENVIVGFNTDLHLYDIVNIKYKRHDSYSQITNDELDSIIYSNESKSIKKIEKDKSSFIGVNDVDVKLVSSIITSIKIDSENISNPIGFSGRDVELNIMNTFLPYSIYSNINIIVKKLNLKPFAILPLVLVYPKLIENSFQHSDSKNIFIDIGFNHVSLSITKNSEIKGFHTFNMGLESLQKELTKKFNLTPIEAENALIDYKIEYRSVINKYLYLIVDMIGVSVIDIDKSFIAKNIFYLSDKKTLFDTLLKKSLDKSPLFKNAKFHSKIDLNDFKFYDEDDGGIKNYSTLALSLMIKDVVPQKGSNIVGMLKNFFIKYRK